MKHFTQPDEVYCGECGEPCKVIALDNSFDYSGTHCTGGKAGTHYPSGYGSPISDCCEATCYDEYGDDIESLEEDEPDYDI